MRVLVVAASPEPTPSLPQEVDFIIGVDGGYHTLIQQGIKPDLLVGDFDSFQGIVPDEAIRYPSEKDVTDLEIALEVARERGADRIEVYGALGGRLDMTLSNVGLLEAYPEMRLHSVGQEIRLAGAGRYSLMRRTDHYLSFLPWKEAIISIHGVKYPLHEHKVVSHEALTISNEWTEEVASLEVHSGKVLIMYIQK